MLDIFICEDNKQQLNSLIKIINNLILFENYDMRIKVATHDPYEILKVVEESNYPCIYFIDIELGSSINGIALSEKIRKYDSRGFIIFITTHDNMRPLTFQYKVEALDYIIKNNIKSIEQRISECLVNVLEKYLKATHEVVKIFHIDKEDRTIHIEYNQMFYIETSATAHKVILHANDRQIEFYGNLDKIIKVLDKRFCRCHKSFIVNKEKIKEVDKKNRVIRLTNDEVCLVSRRMFKEIS
ncbi:MAG: LytTR family DNA-binding domain-containing protein [Clostridia bacterium]|jgi:two-component system response regulator AgrA